MTETLARIPLASISLDPDNMRLDVDDRADLIASIREVGVIEPLLVRPLDDGTFRVVAGERRYLSAIDAGREDVPCVVATDADLQVALKRLHENIGRDDLSPAEKARGVQQVLAFGGDVKSLAKGLNTTQVAVKTMARVAAMPEPVIDAVHVHRLTLEQALTVGEIEATHPEIAAWAVERIGNGDNVEFVITTAQAQVAHLAKVDAARTAAEKDGVPFYTELPDVYDLIYADDAEDLATHKEAGCLAALVDAETEGDVDYLCLAPESHRALPPGSQPGDEAEAGATTDDAADEAARTAALAEQRAREATLAARRRVIANNKAFDVANAARTQWLADFTQRKSAPKGAILPIGRLVRLLAPETSAYKTAMEQQGKSADWYAPAITIAEQITTEAEATKMLLVAAITTAEARISREVWRQTNGWVGVYLTTLTAWGYVLTPPEAHLVERLSTGAKTDDTDYPTQ